MNFKSALFSLDELSTGVTFLDEEHQGLFDRFLALIDDMERDADFSRFVAGVERIAKEIQAHFLREEQVMRNIEYPGYSVHSAEHHRMVEDLLGFINNLVVGFSKEHLSAVTEYFSKWFLSHVKEHDARIKQHLNGSNEQPDSVPRGSRRAQKLTSRSSKQRASLVQAPPNRALH